MNKTELLHLLEETVPPLRGKLHIERVLYQKAANKAYMSFLSDELVTEHDYLLLERRLRELFPKLTVALRIASPSLGEKFLADLNRYKPVLTDFLRRQSPALAAWIADTGWSLEDGRILLTCPDQIAMGFFRSHHLDEKLSQAIYDIFRVRTPVALTVCGEREAWVEKMRADRGFSFAASPTPDDEPPPWDDAELDAQAAALFGGAPAKAPALPRLPLRPRARHMPLPAQPRPKSLPHPRAALCSKVAPWAMCPSRSVSWPRTAVSWSSRAP